MNAKDDKNTAYIYEIDIPEGVYQKKNVKQNKTSLKSMNGSL